MRLSGELDSLDLLEAEQHFAGSGRTSEKLIVDILAVPYVGLHFIGRLLRLHTQLNSNGGSMAVVLCQLGVARRLEQTGLAALLDVFDYKYDAVAQFGSLPGVVQPRLGEATPIERRSDE